MKVIFGIVSPFILFYLCSCNRKPGQMDTSGNTHREYTPAEKIILRDGFIESSQFMQSLQKDTSEMVASCFVDKYVTKFNMKEIESHGTMTMKELSDITMPLLYQCLEQFGIIKRELEEG